MDSHLFVSARFQIKTRDNSLAPCPPDSRKSWRGIKMFFSEVQVRGQLSVWVCVGNVDVSTLAVAPI